MSTVTSFLTCPVGPVEAKRARLPEAFKAGETKRLCGSFSFFFLPRK